MTTKKQALIESLQANLTFDGNDKYLDLDKFEQIAGIDKIIQDFYQKDNDLKKVELLLTEKGAIYIDPEKAKIQQQEVYSWPLD